MTAVTERPVMSDGEASCPSLNSLQNEGSVSFRIGMIGVPKL